MNLAMPSVKFAVNFDKAFVLWVWIVLAFMSHVKKDSVVYLKSWFVFLRWFSQLSFPVIGTSIPWKIL